MAKTKHTKHRSKKAASTRNKARSLQVSSRAPLADSRIEVIARGCLIEGSFVLLCRNIKHGYMYLPGGHVEFGESAAAALAREFLEECGLRVRVGHLVLVSEGAFATRKRSHHEMNLVFHVERTKAGGGGGRPSPVRSREAAIEFLWVDLSAVVDQDIRPTSAKAWLASLIPNVESRLEWVSEIEA